MTFVTGWSMVVPVGVGYGNAQHAWRCVCMLHGSAPGD